MFMFKVNRQAVLTIVTLSIVTVLFGMVGMVQAEIVQPYANDSDTALLYHLNETTYQVSTSTTDYFIDDSSSNKHLRTTKIDVDGSDAAGSPFQGVSGPNGLGVAANITSARRMLRVGEALPTLSTTTFTIEAWIRNPGLNGDGIFRVNDDPTGSCPLVQFQILADSKLKLIARDSDNGVLGVNSTQAVTFSADTWYHLAVTYDNNGLATDNDSTVEFFCDPVTSLGASSRAGTKLGDTIESLKDLKAFAASTGQIWAGEGGGNLDGDIDEVRYSNVVRDTFNLAVPEPGSVVLLLSGLLAMALVLYRRKRR